MNVDLTLVFLGLLVFSAHLFASLYNRKKIPDVLFLIIIGLILGPALSLVDASSLGVSGPVFVAVTLVVILFEGGTTLSFNVMQSAWKSTMSLTMTCFFLSMALVAATTSCTKGRPHRSAMPMPMEPVICTDTSASPVLAISSSRKGMMVSLALALWRL